jgi:lipoprotein NlpD
MKPTPRLALLTLSIALSACSTATRQAPVIDRPAPPAANKTARLHPPAPPAPAPEEPKADARGGYTVRKGDTLLRIALDFGQNYRDLVAWNNLADPDDIKVGQVLRVVPPERNSGVAGTNPVLMPGLEKPAAPPKKTAPRGDKKAYIDNSRHNRHRQRRRTAELDVAVRRPHHRHLRRRQEQGHRYRRQARPAGDGRRLRKGDVRGQRHPRIW